MLSHDARLRCDMVDLYYALYGSKRPPGMVSAELTAMFRPQKVTTAQTTSTGSISTFSHAKIKSEVKTSSPIEEKPLHIIDTIPYEQLVNVDDSASRESGVNLLHADAGDVKSSQMFINAGMVLATGPSGQDKPESDGSNSRQIKEEIIDVDELDIKDEPPPAKKLKTDYNSDNSASLPGIAGATGAASGPVGFEPGMFKQEDVGTLEIGESIVSGSSKTKGDSTQKVCNSQLGRSFCQQFEIIFFTSNSRRRKRRTRRSTSASTKANTTRTRTRRKTRTRQLFASKRRPKRMRPKRSARTVLAIVIRPLLT